MGVSIFAQRAERFRALHANADTRPFISNLRTQVELLHHGGLTLPVTVNHAEPDNAWVCSPRSTYCDYAIEELQRYLPPLLAAPLRLLCRAYGYALGMARVDQAVALNNWMLSTNLYPPLDHAALGATIEEARQRWPGHALWLRSLNAHHNQDWLTALVQHGFSLIPSRQVYLFDNLADGTHANLQRDLQLLQKTPLIRMLPADFGADDFERIEALYRALYLQKYSLLNPQYTARFLQTWHAAGLLEFHGFKDQDGEIQTVVGIFRQGRTLTAPIVGYNTTLPQALGLYRLAMACVFDLAIRDHATVNLSAGAASFKRLRGGRPEIEYSAVLTQHLPAYRRTPLAVLQKLLTGIGVPVMKRFEL